MKKIEKVSIAGISFTLDTDAYDSLKGYLDSLHRHYEKDPDGGEITRDIEARIAELILDRQVYTKVVDKGLVDTIVAQLGSAEQIDDDVATDGTGYGAERIAKRLYRTRSPRIFGGVCGGLANYFNVNVAWVRVLFLLPFLFELLTMSWGGWMERMFDGPVGVWQSTFFIAYVILWVAVPVARTPRQNLEARGERITADSIRQSLNSAAETPTAKRANSVVAEILIVFGRIVLFFVKFVCACMAFAFIVGGLAMLMALVLMVVNPAGMVMGSTVAALWTVAPWLWTLVVFCVMLPLLMGGFDLMCFVFGWRTGRVGRVLRISAVVVWFVAFFGALSIAGSRQDAIRDAIRQNGGGGHHRWEYNWSWGNDDDDDDRQEQWRREIRVVPAPSETPSLDTPDSLTLDAPQPDSVSVSAEGVTF